VNQKQMEAYVRERLASGRKSYKSLIMPIGEAKWANYAPLDECLRRMRQAGIIAHAMAGGGKVAGYEFVKERT
jgi:hypothetical protein